MSMQLMKAEARREVARYLGFGDVMSSTEAAVIDDAVLNGLREFYFHHFGGGGHDWSFLTKRGTVAFEAAVDDYELPGDFLRLSSVVTIAGAEFPCSQITESAMRMLGHRESESGTPIYFAIVPSEVIDGRQRYSLQFFPVPAAEGQAVFRYLFDPLVDPDVVVLPGGPVHAKTILQCMLAQAERSMNLESVAPTGGPHQIKAEAMLMASIDADRRLQGLPAVHQGQPQPPQPQEQVQ